LTNIKMDKPIRLSDPIAGAFKYLTPFIITWVGTIWYVTNEHDTITPTIIVVGGLAYWLFMFLPLKRVFLDGNHLIISSGFKKDRIHLNDIESLKTGGWSMYITHVHFKRPTSFGKTIMFATMQKRIGVGINDGIQNILTQINDYIEKKK